MKLLELAKRELKQRRFWATLVHRKWKFFILGQIVSIMESFRFGDENDYEYEMWLKVLLAYSLKIDTLESFIVHFSPEKLPLLSLLKEVKPSTGRKTSNIWWHVSATTLPKTRSGIKMTITFSCKKTRWFTRKHCLRKSRIRSRPRLYS